VELGSRDLERSIQLHSFAAWVHKAPRLVATSLAAAKCEIAAARGWPGHPCGQVKATSIQGLSMQAAAAPIVCREKTGQTHAVSHIYAVAILRVIGAAMHKGTWHNVSEGLALAGWMCRL